MSLCRNEIINTGANSWPRSCATCGIAKYCPKGVKTKYDKEEPMKYAVVLEEYYMSDGGYPEDGSSRVNYLGWKEFENKEALEKYILANHQRTYGDKIKKIIEYRELKATTTVSVDLV